MPLFNIVSITPNLHGLSSKFVHVVNLLTPHMLFFTSMVKYMNGKEGKASKEGKEGIPSKEGAPRNDKGEVHEDVIVSILYPIILVCFVFN